MPFQGSGFLGTLNSPEPPLEICAIQGSGRPKAGEVSIQVGKEFLRSRDRKRSTLGVESVLRNLLPCLGTEIGGVSDDRVPCLGVLISWDSDFGGAIFGVPALNPKPSTHVGQLAEFGLEAADAILSMAVCTFSEALTLSPSCLMYVPLSPKSQHTFVLKAPRNS